MVTDLSKDVNSITLRGIVQGVRSTPGWRTIQLATDAGGARTFAGGSMTPIVYVFNNLKCPDFKIGSHVEIRGHIQPFKANGNSKREYEDIIAADLLTLTRRDLSYFVRIRNGKYDEYDGGYPDDINQSFFIGTFESYKEPAKQSARGAQRISVRLNMKTRDMETGKENENVCSIICYGKQAELIREKAAPGCRLAITGRTRTTRKDSVVIQQQSAKDVYIIDNL